MSTPRSFTTAILVLACAFFTSHTARAQFAVIDVPAIAQLIQQVQMMEQALTTARSQLSQAQQALQAMTGDRGMQHLLGGVVRNYLPADWGQMAATLDPTVAGFSALGADVQRIIAANALLSGADLTRFSAGDQAQLAAARRLAAAAQAVARDALAHASGRFASLQTLIDAIGAAKDQKGVLDLQARITAEQGMLQNEQTKLQSLRHALDAEAQANAQLVRERIIAGHGDFSHRFQPAP